MHATYTQRLNLLKKSRTWTLRPHGLTWQEAHAEGDISYDEIESVHLKYVPTRTELRRISLQIRSAASRIELTNIDFEGPLKTKEQTVPFLEFVHALHGALADENPRIRYRVGRSPLGFLAVATLVISLIVLLVGTAIAYADDQVSGSVALKLALTAVFLPTLIKDLRVNGPGTYDPRKLPTAITELH